MGNIKVTVQTEKRLNAINNLSEAIKFVAKALDSGTRVEITDNVFKGGDPTVSVDAQEEVFETIVEKI